MIATPVPSTLDASRASWAETAVTIDRLNRSNPNLGLETARERLARERAADWAVVTLWTTGDERTARLME